MAEQGDLVLKITADASRATRTIDAFRSKIEDLNAILVQSKTHMSTFTNSSNTMSQALATQLNQNLSQVNTKLDKMAEKSKKTAKAVKPVSVNLRQVGRDMSFLVSLPAAAFLRSITKEFLSLDKALAQATALIPNLNSDMRNLARGGVKDVSNLTGVASKEVSGMLMQLLKAGISFDSAMASLQTAAVTARAAGGQNTSKLIDDITDIQIAFGMGSDNAAEFGKNFRSISNMLLAASTSSTASADQIATAMKNQAAAIAKVMGLSIEETFALSATMASVGTKGSKAGREMAQIYSNLTAAAAKNKGAFEEHLPIFDKLTGDYKKQGEVIGILTAKLGSLNNLERATFLKEKLGLQERSSKVMMKLVGTNSIYAKSLEEVTANGDKANEMLDNIRNTASGRMDDAMNSLKNSFESMGHSLLPVFERIAAAIAKVADIINNMSPSTKRFIAMLAGAVAVGGPLLLMVSTAVSLGKALIGIKLGALAAAGGLTAALGAMSVFIASATAVVIAVKSAMDALDAMAEEARLMREPLVKVNSAANELASLMGKAKREGTSLASLGEGDEDLKERIRAMAKLVEQSTGHSDFLKKSTEEQMKILRSIRAKGKILDLEEEKLKKIKAIEDRRKAALDKQKAEQKRIAAEKQKIVDLTKELLKLETSFADITGMMGKANTAQMLGSTRSIMEAFNQQGGLLAMLGISGTDNKLESTVASIFAKHGIVGDKLEKLFEDAAKNGLGPALVKVMGKSGDKVAKAIEKSVTGQRSLIDRQIKELESRIKAIQKKPAGVAGTPTASAFNAVKTGTVEAYKLLFGIDADDDSKEQKQLSIDQLNELKRLNKQTAELKKQKEKLVFKIG